MKELLSNSWVVSIISGILVFFITNAIIMLQNKRKHKKQIKDANSMVLNRIRGYVVDNGLPQKEVIEAVKSATSREYEIKYNELLSIREFCEELIADIIGNTYISNDNKVKYLNTLQEYLKENLKESDKSHEQSSENNNTLHKIKKIRRKNYYIKQKYSVGSSIAEIILPMIISVVTIIAVFMYSHDKPEIMLNGFDVYSVFIQATVAVIILVLFLDLTVFVLSTLKIIVKKKKKKEKKKKETQNKFTKK